MKISVIINTFNSEASLAQCLESVVAFDEIIVCDMYSSDNTLQIAKQFGCKILMHERTGIVEPARNFAIQAASCEWVFVVDSDEIVPSQLRTYLYNHINRKDATDALYIPRRNFFMDRFMHGAYPDYILRFMKKETVFWPPYIHATPEINGSTSKVPAKKNYSFIHLANETVSSRIKKLDVYTDKEIERRTQKQYNGLSLLVNSSFRFFKMYILKKGFLDGKPGLIYALFNSFYKILTIAKVWEREAQKNKPV